MKIRKFLAGIWVDVVAFLAIGFLFLLPFAFITLQASKSTAEAALLQFNFPSQFKLFQNMWEVLTFGDNRMIRALWNSLLLTAGSVALTVLFSTLAAFVIQRRNDRLAMAISSLMLVGLIFPPAVVPTIFLLQRLHIYKTIFGLMMIEVAFQMPFSILVCRAFMSTIPREIDESAIIDGASPLHVFTSIILPLMRPAIITVIVVSAVFIYNDFALPLYFLPGTKNITAQVTLYSFMSQFLTQWNLLFADVLIVMIPPFIMFLFFERQIVSGMTTGAIRG